MQIDVYVSEKVYRSGKPRRYAFLSSEKPYSSLPKNENWTFVRSGQVSEFHLSTEVETAIREAGVSIGARYTAP